jgi:hypothetical protein
VPVLLYYCTVLYCTYCMCSLMLTLGWVAGMYLLNLLVHTVISLMIDDVGVGIICTRQQAEGTKCPILEILFAPKVTIDVLYCMYVFDTFVEAAAVRCADFSLLRGAHALLFHGTHVTQEFGVYK